MELCIEKPSVDEWLKEAKALECSGKIGMYLLHNGVVRSTAKAQVRLGETSMPVVGMHFSYDRQKVKAVLEAAQRIQGIYHVRLWLNEGNLSAGDDIMYLLVGGDIRPRVIEGLQYIVSRIKNECVTEQEQY